LSDEDQLATQIIRIKAVEEAAAAKIRAAEEAAAAAAVKVAEEAAEAQLKVVELERAAAKDRRMLAQA